MSMIPVNEPLMPGREMEYVADCIATGWISSAGKYIDRFENEWAAYCGRKFGVAVCNGTAALELALSALDIPAGREVILPSFTIVSCLEAVIRNNLIPVLVDCDPQTYCMDIADVRRKISPKTAVVMPVHIYGHPVNMSELLLLAQQFNLKVLEDTAEAHGAKCLVDNEWKRCGSFGDVSIFSFYANKIITTGEGGMVLTDNPVIAAKLRERRNLCFGVKERFKHEDRGWNYRMTNIQAAMGCAQLERIDQFLSRKLDMAAKYNQSLKGLPLQLPHEELWAKTSVWMYAVVLEDNIPFDATEFARRLMARNIQTRPFFTGMHEQSVYRNLGFFHDVHCPVTDRISRRGLYLPSGQAITDTQIESVCNAVRDVLSFS